VVLILNTSLHSLRACQKQQTVKLVIMYLLFASCPRQPTRMDELSYLLKSTVVLWGNRGDTSKIVVKIEALDCLRRLNDYL